MSSRKVAYICSTNEIGQKHRSWLTEILDVDVILHLSQHTSVTVHLLRCVAHGEIAGSSSSSSHMLSQNLEKSDLKRDMMSFSGDMFIMFIYI